MSGDTVARYSTGELRAAAAALAAGQFSTTSIRPGQGISDRQSRPGDDDAGALTASQPDDDGWEVGAPRRATRTAVPGPLVRVRAANSGAGASTIALALADAADASGISTRVLDAAAPAWSGLLGATVTELGACEGWRRGRRGHGVLIDRVDEAVSIPADVPCPRSATSVDLTLLDAGWSMRELATCGADVWVAAAPAQAEVLVTRPHGLALSQTEAALTELDEHLAAERVVVVVVGATRWSSRDFKSAGRLLRTAQERGAVLFSPLLPTKALPGLSPDALPKQLTSPSQRLLERITSITEPLGRRIESATKEGDR